MRFLPQCKLLLLLLSARAHVVAGQEATRPACGQIVHAEDEFIFDAKLVYECLTSVPFNQAVATRFIKYYNDTLEFHSTVDFLKDPPEGYQQPSVDLRDGLQMLQDAVASNSFANQYEFEVKLQKLILAAHDSHLYLSAGILSAFTFGSPRALVSLSIDGIEAPKLYFAEHVFDSDSFRAFQPSAIKLINGQDAVAYLEEFAANQSSGAVESHTDWNQLMFSYAQNIQGSFSLFGWNAPFYFGDTITFEFENKTETTEDLVGIYWSQGLTGPLETGGDFYNFFVLGFYPANFDPHEPWTTDPASATDPASTTTSLPDQATSSATPALSWDSPAYPKIPDVAQPGLGTYGGGFFSGYFLNSSSVSVLSIPSFDEYDDALNTAQDTVREFIRRSKDAGLQKVVIDLQQNTGGQVLLAVDVFKQFFPSIEPFVGSQMRASHASNIMGQTVTRAFEGMGPEEEYYRDYLVSEWVSSARLNAETGTNFTSWGEYFGPIPVGDHAVTRTQRYDFSNQVFIDESAEGGHFDLNPEPTNENPWAPEDIIILTDGVCGSSCALFVEMMHHEAGVRVVAVGGRPVEGPMQAVGYSRGARTLLVTHLDQNIEVVQNLLEGSPDAHFLPNRTEANDVFIVGATINLRDQVRPGETIPLQFAYEPADCRIYFTPQTIFNYTALWQYAADAIWTKPSLCVAGSTGVLPSNSTKSSAQPFDLEKYVSLNTPLNPLDSPVGELSGDLLGGSGRNSQAFKDCSPSVPNSCGKSMVCKPQQRFTNDPQPVNTCVPTCRGSQSPCRALSAGVCIVTATLESERSKSHFGDTSSGYCKCKPIDNRYMGMNRTVAILQ